MQIIIHIGHSKTGSTSIQRYADRNRSHFAAQGVLYPTAFGMKKSFLNRRAAQRGRGVPREVALSRLDEEFSSDFTKAVVSDETIYRRPGRDKREIRRLFEKYASSWRILLYVRRPDEHIVSHYQQNIRNFSGFKGSFDTFFYKMMYIDYYRFFLQVKRWENIFGTDAVAVRVFHRRTLQGSPVEDFLRWTGLDPATLPTDDSDPANVSLDRAGIEILRYVNAHRDRDPDLARGTDIRHVRNRLRALTSDDLLRLDIHRAKRLHEQFRPDHERLAERYLTPEHAAVLLAPPAEAPMQPPVAPELLYERTMAVFANPDLARRAVEQIRIRTLAEARMAERRESTAMLLARIIKAAHTGYGYLR